MQVCTTDVYTIDCHSVHFINRITDVENSILGVPSYYHHYLYSYELRKIQVTNL